MGLPPRRWPVLSSATERYGLLHRLDVPSSGLVLVAKSHTAYCDLQLQLAVNKLIRDYAGICHGWMPLGRKNVCARVHWTEASQLPSRVRLHGKPSVTWTKVLAHALLDAAAVAAVAFQLGTGRQHQIRLHDAHIGHPVAFDSKYMAGGAAHSSTTWCHRTFLHRHRLEFADGRHMKFQAWMPLPADLVEALSMLRPRAGLCADALRQWLHGAGVQHGWMKLQSWSRGNKQMMNEDA